MAKIFTKTGDKGSTSLANGERVAKDDARIEFNGEMDKLNAMFGMVRALGLKDAPMERLQQLLMSFMSLVALPEHEPTTDELRPFAEATAFMEKVMTDGQDHTPFQFVVPGTGVLSCWLHLARAQARTCERRLVTIARQKSARGEGPAFPDEMLRFLNRLSDYLFFLALRQSAEEQ